MILNPSMKLDWFRYFTPHRLHEAKELFLHEVKSYAAAVASDSQQTTLSDLSNDNWADTILSLPTKDKQPDEINGYLSEALANPKKDEIAYWEVRHSMSGILIVAHNRMDIQDSQACFPTIFHLALDILPIQASSVPCVRVFSLSSDTDTKKRNWISPELNEALQMLKFTLQHGNPLSFTDGTSLEEELAVLKQLLAEQCDKLEDKKVLIEKLLQMTARDDK
ncbi:hypothetical protein D9758_017672 [Tetrapyrgos nigripes]|uniref:HAT C-terminal dimerisation domain-containing protein n=1 Tax=Tetrapyrgos nigripes TaxID=182062 RepID=A0A8H5BQZ1_9AGAR|nr:hypothetical protein D9758_017672 [Tetrapyrgos nigripes]